MSKWRYTIEQIADHPPTWAILTDDYVHQTFDSPLEAEKTLHQWMIEDEEATAEIK